MKNIAAALLFFTRLPFWRLKAFQVSPEYFKQVINYWAVTGWLTAATMVCVLWFSAQILPYSVAIILAFASRLLITGALHEDGLADFFDGFGGGTTKERILAIMKDSHIGTYGVIGLIFYFLFAYVLFSELTIKTACIAILIGDPLCKFIAAQITRFLPYARTEETSKSKTVYEKISIKTFAISAIFVFLPFLLIDNLYWLLTIILPIIVFCGIITLIRNKIGGYTGDCCGAIFLLCELSFYLSVVLINQK